jgi:hypothetical protein
LGLTNDIGDILNLLREARLCRIFWKPAVTGIANV